MNDSTVIPELIKKYETPFYIFDYDELKARVNILKSKLPSNAKLCYAIKANPFLIPSLKNEDILFEVCSPGELTICQNYNVSNEKIVFSGVCKTKEDIKKAYNLKVNTITLESPLHCQYLIEIINETKNVHQQDVILRISSGNQFGMSKEDILNCIKKLKHIDSVNIRGIHYFSGTQKKINKILEEINFLEKLYEELATVYGATFTNVEYGPGLSYNYFSSTNEADNFLDFDTLSNTLSKSRLSFVIELGRYIASSCGTYVTKIMDIKKTEDKNYCIIDGGINHINYYGQMLGMKIPTVLHYDCFNTPTHENIKEKYTICGSLCTTADILLRELELSKPITGDYLAFKDIGAYSITEGIYLFLSHPLPSVITIENNTDNLIRSQIESSIINSANII